MSPAKPKVNTLFINSGPVALPRATAAPIPAVTTATSREACFQGVSAVTGFTASAAAAVGAAGAGGGAGRGTTGRISPLYVTIEPRTT